jgi:O-antigen/teichoic acid export membrane protein
MKNILKQIRIGGWLAILGSSSHLLNYLTLLFLVRTLDTAEYAVYGYAVSIMSILGVVAVFLPDLVSRILLEMGDSHKMTLAQFNHLETLILKALIALGAIFILFAWQDISPFKGLSIPFVISMQTVLIAAHLNGFYAGILNFDGRFVRVLLSNAALTAGRFVGIY